MKESQRKSSVLALDTYDELLDPSGEPRPQAAMLVERLQEFDAQALFAHQQAAASRLRDMGITFYVYGDDAGKEKVWPFDVIPRIFATDEWSRIEAGLAQRVQALNLFLADLYGPQKILDDEIVPRDLIYKQKGYLEACRGFVPRRGVFCHISGTDLVRGADGTIYVLEDNVRVPSGVSYVLENRAVMKRTFPEVFEGLQVRPVEDYPERLLQMLLEVAPEGVDDPRAVVLTPGSYNSAYFEHSFLAQQMGVELVQGSDLVVHEGRVRMRTTRGLERVDVIYRRIDDDFLDPKVFREDSLLGVPGIMDVYREGRVSIVNAPGTGVADDKAVYAYLPKIIRYYLSEEPILPNVPTYLCRNDSDLRYVLENLETLVVKPTNASGGYGIVIGPKASKAEIDACRERVRADPKSYIAQPVIQLSTVPTVTEAGWDPRHVDLRPFVLCGKDVYVLPGGLTRVALKKGSLVVNSSQGGGSKDTWVLGDSDRGAP
ncbi:MAG: circularly permuted type 2 ATP-grasp protein [Myxococcota bacterium]